MNAPVRHHLHSVESHELARAQEDYQRLRAAYLDIARNEPGHEVALAMIGSDMDRAHRHLQSMLDLQRLPFTQEFSVSDPLQRESLQPLRSTV